MRFFDKALKLNLALQGGGAHGAFTWGVLDRLLEEERLEIGCISGTSAGAVNAVAVAAGLVEGGREGARWKLRQVWQAVYEAGVPDLMRLNPFLYSLTRASFSQMTGLMSPYEFNPMGFDPLRRLLERTIDFSSIRAAPPVGLLIAATEVASGRPRYFRAVVIEGKAYWDGGFSANPDIVNLARQSAIGDTLLIMINPIERLELPTGSREITGHINHITFNAPLRRDVELIEALRRDGRPGWFDRHSLTARLMRHRYHLVDAGRYTSLLKPETKMKPDWGLFTYLHGAGRTEMHKWLDRHRADVGRRETARLAERVLGDAPRIAEEGMKVIEGRAADAADAVAGGALVRRA